MKIAPRALASTAKLPAAKNGIELGLLEKPGAKLKGTIQKLKPGQSLTFSTRENQIWGLGGGLTVKPAGAKVTSKQLQPMKPGVLGNTSLNQYTITLPKDAKPGTSITVTSKGNYQVRADPNWAFSFKIAISK